MRDGEKVHGREGEGWIEKEIVRKNKKEIKKKEMERDR